MVLLCMIGLQTAQAKTEKVHATFAEPSNTNTTWNAETKTFTWSTTYYNQLKNIGLPNGDLTKYKKLVVDCDIKSGNQFRILFYKGGSNLTLYASNGVNEFILADTLKAIAPNDYNEYLLACDEICLSGNNSAAPGEAVINDVYLETYDDEGEKVYATFAEPSNTNTTWNAETKTFTWSTTYYNQLKNIGLPNGDLTKYKKLVVDCDIKSGNQFRILFYKGGSNLTLYASNGVNEFILADTLKAIAPNDYNEYLLACDEICLSGNNAAAPGEAVINAVYLETYPENESVEIPDIVYEEDPGKPVGDFVDFTEAFPALQPRIGLGLDEHPIVLGNGDVVVGQRTKDVIADLSAYSKLTMVTSPNLKLVVYMNHEVDAQQNAGDYAPEDEGKYVFLNVQADENGIIEIDLTQYDKQDLNCICLPWDNSNKGTVWYLLLTNKEEDVPEFLSCDFEGEAESNAIGIRTYNKDIKGEEVAQMQAITGWTIAENGDARAAGIFAYGSESFLGGEGYVAPAAKYAFDEGETKALGLVGVWSANLQYTLDVPLEPGNYLMQVPVYNAGGANAVSANKIGADGTFADTKEFPVNQWTVLNVEFTVESAKDVTLSLGYAAANSGSAAMPHLFLESASLYSGDEAISAAKTMAEARCAALNAVIALDKAKEAKLAALNALVPGEGLFQYDAQAINLAKEAVVLAETVEAVEAVAMPTPTQPDPEKQYTFQLKDGGKYMAVNEGIKLADKAYPFSFVAVEGGWALKSGDEYVANTGGNAWTMSMTADPYAWAISALGEGYYTLAKASNKAQLVGINDNAEAVAGTPCYADKKAGDKSTWTIAEYVAPVLYTVSISNEIENGTVAAEPASAEAGTKIQLTATPAEGYQLISYDVRGVEVNEVILVAEDGTFEMPAFDVSVSATFAEQLDVTISDEIENGTVTAEPAKAAAGTKVQLKATPAEGYRLDSYMVTCNHRDEVILVAEDGSFTMPNDDVTVSATFIKAIYIETDLTAQFPIDWNGWTGATGYVGWAAPEVTTNDGRKTPACERYESTCANTGVVFSRQLTGLANGLYTIELYGAAAFTSGRGFDSELTEGDETAVYLYAQTPAGEVKQYIPAHVATDFNGTGIATAKLENVEVTDGTINIGMAKDKPYTNWHVVQIKGVTARVDAAGLLAIAVAAAEAIEEASVPAALYTELTEALTTYDKIYETADEYQTAIDAIEAVVATAEAYAPLTAVLAQGEIYKSHVAAGDAAIATYEEAIADVAAAYTTVNVADIPAAIAIVEAALPALAKAQTADGSDMTLAIVNPEINGADGWTCEKPLGGNGPLLNNTAFEYWAGNASNRAEASFDYYQVIEGLPNGLYTVSADMYNSTNGEDGAVFAPTSGVYASADNEEATLVDVDGTDWITYATDVVLVSDGKLRIGVKSTEKPMAARWFAADNFKLTLVKALSETELAYEKAIASIEDSASYRIFTTVNEKKFYLNSTGYLVADANKAASFTFAEVNVAGTLYETGINLGCKFTNPKLTSGATGDVVKQGHIIVGTNDRNDWERQVFFLKDGKYAVRATNANSEEWGANTYWTVDNIEAELPNAEYALAPAYVWEIEKYVDNRPAAYAKAQTWAAKLQAIEGLVTDAANWTTNAQETREGAMKNICDGDVSTFFHSQWSGTGPDADHYIQATLPEAAQKFHIAFYKRNDSNRPTSIVVSAGDAEPAQTITEGLPAPAWYSAEVDLGTAADVVRFTVPTTSTGGANNGHVFFTFGEFYILPSNELTDAACKYIVSDYTDIDPDFDPAEIESIDAQIEAAYQQIMLKEELADLAACIARGKEFIAAYPVEDAEQLAQEATGTLDRLAEGEYTTKEEVASAKANAILTVQLFIGATGTPTVDADITEWFVKSPTPIATQAVAEGWEGDKFGDASDGVSEYWNKAAATFHQTITLPAGDYKLTVVALQRTNMAGVVYAGDAQKTIAQATTDEANSRGQAAAWFNAGNGVNEVKFTMAEAGEIEIGLITDNTTGDHWTVWQSFKIEKLAPVPPVAFTVTPNIASGTQAEFTTVEAGSALKLTVSTENLEANGYNPKDISLKVGTLFAGRFSDKGFATGTNERPPYMKNDIVLPLADEVTLADDVFGTEYPFIQSIRITDLSLVKGEEPIAAINEMIVISFIEVYENGAPVGIKAIATEGEKADIYDLSGRKVEKVQRGGIYIINGKKVSMK